MLPKYRQYFFFSSDDEELAKALRKSNEFLVKFCKFQNITENDVFWAFGVLQTNSIGLANGRGLYPIASIMSHSCVPTLTLMTKLGEGIAFKSNRIIADQEELTIRWLLFIILGSENYKVRKAN